MFPRLPFDFAGHHFMDFAVQLQMHIYGRSEEQFRNWEAHKDGLLNVEQVTRWQQHIHRCAVEALGGLPLSDAPLKPKVCGELKGGGFRVEKVVFESRPGVQVTSALYVPEGLKGKSAAVLFVCGHSEAAKGYPVYQAVCQRLARNGLVVLAVDPPGQGERKSYLDADGREIVGWGTTEHSYAGLQCWFIGHSPARYFIHDAMRGIDYLESRPEVDAERIGVTGNSGGGTQSTWLMMVEPRLKAAAPGTFVMRRLEYMWTGQAQDGEQIIPFGTLNGLDHEDFLIAMAPKPVIVLAAEYDFFNIEGTIASVERAKRIYGLFGKEDNLQLAMGRHTHQYSPELARRSTEFFCGHFLGKPASDVDHSEPEPFRPEELWCTEKGQLLLANPKTRCIFEQNLDEFEALSAGKGGGKARAEKAALWLRGRVERYRKPLALFPRWPWENRTAGLDIAQGFWFTEPRVCNAGFLVRSAEEDYEDLTIALFDRGTLDMKARQQWIINEIRAGHALLVVDVRGMGNLRPRAINPADIEERYGTLYKFISDLVFLGDDLASMRIYDVLRAVELASTDPLIALGRRPIRLFGSGIGGYYGYLAAALEPRVSAAEIEDALFSVQSVVRSRYYHNERVNQMLIYGMAAELDLADLRPLFKGRELVVRRPRNAEGGIIKELET